AVGSHEVTNRVTLRVIRPETWETRPMAFVGSRPTYAHSNGAHPEWYPPEQCFVFWQAVDETLYKLHPPAGDLLTGTWEFTAHQMQRSLTHPPTKIDDFMGKNMWNK